MVRLFCLMMGILVSVIVSAQEHLFTVSVDGKRADVVQFKDISYACFTISGASQVEIEYHKGIEKYTISPLSKNIKSERDGNRISFNMQPAYYVVEVNDTNKLFLLADVLEKDIPDITGKKIIDVTSYLPAAPYGETLLTAQLQQALDDASGSGKILYFPPGEYLTGTLVVKSNTTLYLSKGAVIKGSPNRDDYPTDDGRLEADHINRKDSYTDNGEFMTFSRLILIDQAKNVKIYGQGVIDGNGSVVRAQGKPANLIRIRHSENILIEGVMLRNPAAWNTHIQYCNKITMRHVKIINDPQVPNTDGIDPDASTRVLVENCFAYCSDDNIAIKSTNNLSLLKDVNHIVVRGCTFLTRKSALKVGTETKAKVMENITFENNDIVECDRALVLYCYDGALFKNISFRNNRVEKNHPDNQRKAIHFSIMQRNGAGKIQKVQIEDCIFYTKFPRKSVMAGLDDEHCIEGVTIKNMVVEGRKVNNLEEADIEVNHVNQIVFK